MVWEYIAVLVREKCEGFPRDPYDAKEVVMYFRNDRMDPPNHPRKGDIIEIYHVNTEKKE